MSVERVEVEKKKGLIGLSLFPLVSLTLGTPVDTPASTVVAHEVRDELEAEMAAGTAAAVLSGRRSGNIDRHCLGAAVDGRRHRGKERERQKMKRELGNSTFSSLSIDKKTNKSSRALLLFFSSLLLVVHVLPQLKNERPKKKSELASRKSREREKRTKNKSSPRLFFASYDAARRQMPSRADVDWGRASWSAQFDEAQTCQRLDDELEKVIWRTKVLF